MQAATRLLGLLFILSGFHFSHAQETKRMVFPGGRFSIVPPQGFTADPSIPALLHIGSASSFSMTEIDSIPYIYIVQGFEKGDESRADWKQISREDVKLNTGNSGVLFTVEFEIKGVTFRRMILFSGNRNYTIMVHATYPLSVESLNAKDMRSALMSIEF